MLTIIINIAFYLSAGLLCAACIVVANSMNHDTCHCKKAILIVLIIGAGMQLMLAWYALFGFWSQLSSIPISLAVSMWLMLDRRTSHEEIESFFNKIRWYWS